MFFIINNCCIFFHHRLSPTLSLLLEKEYGEGAVLAFFHNRQLFSTAIMTKLDRESDCHETTEPIHCPKNAKYRRSDGRCSNLHFPTGGAAGSAYIRAIPAVSKNRRTYTCN